LTAQNRVKGNVTVNRVTKVAAKAVSDAEHSFG